MSKVSQWENVLIRCKFPGLINENLIKMFNQILLIALHFNYELKQQRKQFFTVA